MFKISKEDLFKMLETFPMQAKFLRAVGRQRLQTTTTQDVKGADSSEMDKFEKKEFENALMNSARSMSRASEMKLSSQNDFVLSYSRQASGKFTDLTKKPKIWQTKQYNKQETFLIVPFSPLFNIWNTLLMLTVFYDTFMVPFSIALSFDFYGGFYAIDVLAILVYMADIYMRSKTAITKPSNICFD